MRLLPTKIQFKKIVITDVSEGIKKQAFTNC